MDDHRSSDEYPSILNDIVNNSIEDILVPSQQSMTVDTEYQVITATAFCIKYGGGRRVYFNVTEQMINCVNPMFIEVLNDLSLSRYPGGPYLNWISIFEMLSEESMVISSIDILCMTDSDDSNCHDGLLSGVVLNMNDDRSFGFIPSSFPLWIDLLYNKDNVKQLLASSEWRYVSIK